MARNGVWDARGIATSENSGDVGLLGFAGLDLRSHRGLAECAAKVLRNGRGWISVSGSLRSHDATTRSRHTSAR